MTIHSESDYSYWHIGRFAVDSFVGIPTLTLFKQLMVYADILYTGNGLYYIAPFMTD